MGRMARTPVIATDVMVAVMHLLTLLMAVRCCWSPLDLPLCVLQSVGTRDLALQLLVFQA